MKIALVQKKAVPNDVKANLDLAVRYTEEAGRAGADLVLFPEMWSIGYAPPFPEAFDDPFQKEREKERKAWISQAVGEDSAYIRTLRETAKRLSVGAVITGMYEGEKGPQNEAFLIGREGEILLRYAKVHTCDFSLEALLQSGTSFETAEFDGVRIGIMICYDREFPESARVLMLKGAELILVPNACDMNPARLHQLEARAFENMTGIAMANYPGRGWGQSCAFSPVVFGEDGYQDPTILMASEEEGILMAEFPIEEIREYRKNETWGNAYRKTGAYEKLLDPAVEEPFIRTPLTKEKEEG